MFAAKVNKSSSNSASEMIRQKKENQAVLQLTLIVISYFFGYVPFSCEEKVFSCNSISTLHTFHKLYDFIKKLIIKVFYNSITNSMDGRKIIRLNKHKTCFQKIFEFFILELNQHKVFQNHILSSHLNQNIFSVLHAGFRHQRKSPQQLVCCFCLHLYANQRMCESSLLQFSIQVCFIFSDT